MFSRSLKWLTVFGVIAVLLAGCAQAEPVQTVARSAPEKQNEPEQPEKQEEPEEPRDAGFDHTQHSLDDPSSLWVVNNKQRPLDPIDYAPNDLVLPAEVQNPSSVMMREVAANALTEMTAAAANDGVTLVIRSGYRSYQRQVELYNSYVVRDGEAAADTYSARPGHSEHQTGLTADMDDNTGCFLYQCFAESPGGVWIAQNAHHYGFIVRYPQGKEDVTGFIYEPWHIRFVGVELATEMREQEVLTLEEFFGLPAAPGY